MPDTQVFVGLTNEESVLLGDVLDNWLEGARCAKEEGIIDRGTITSPEDLLEYVAQCDRDIELLVGIKKRLA
jgi:hypothetical protein